MNIFVEVIIAVRLVKAIFVSIVTTEQAILG